MLAEMKIQAAQALSKVDSAKPSRRQILKAGAVAGGGLILGMMLPSGPKVARAAMSADGTIAPNAFVRIAPDDTVTVLSKHLEFGQGSFTGLATLVAEELDADWSKVRVEHAPADATLYNNLSWGPVQGTGGSSAIANAHDQMRRAGATARALLVSAAAKEWSVPESEISVSQGIVSHAGSGKQSGFGALAEAAAGLPAPDAASVALKDPADFTLVGTHVPRKDSPEKVRGQAQYTIDVQRPGMLTALIARPPRFGAVPKEVDSSEALAVSGVTDVVQIPRGIAVVAESFWAAKKGRDALRVEWDDSAAETRSTDEILTEYHALLDKPGLPARVEGDSDTALAGAAQVLEATYEFPYLAHAPMEPLNAVAELTSDGLEVWTGSQIQTIDQGVAAAIAGLDPSKVQIHTLYAGGSFGRRATPDSDMVSEAVMVATAIGGKAPVRVQWTREDDVQGGRYRPMYVHKLRAGLDADGNLVGWQHRIVGQSIATGTSFEGFLVQNGVDQTSVEGANTLPYAIPNMTVDLHTVDSVVPVLWWRAVGSTHTAFSTEAFIDELAAAAGKDPVEFRLAMLADHPRHQGVLKLAAEKAGWGRDLPEGHGLGIAVHESFKSFVAEAAEVSLDDNGALKVHKVVCAVDCGLPVNPDVITAQMEGGIGYGLGAILHDKITLDGGLVEQSNFHDYLPLRIEEMPEVEVHIVPSAEAPTGVGEPGVPPIGPAIANALAAATGQRVRSLPFADQPLGAS